MSNAVALAAIAMGGRDEYGALYERVMSVLHLAIETMRKEGSWWAASEVCAEELLQLRVGIITSIPLEELASMMQVAECEAEDRYLRLYLGLVGQNTDLQELFKNQDSLLAKKLLLVGNKPFVEGLIVATNRFDLALSMVALAQSEHFQLSEAEYMALLSFEKSAFVECAAFGLVLELFKISRERVLEEPILNNVCIIAGSLEMGLRPNLYNTSAA